MSKVYKVRLPVIGKIVALKLFSPHPHMRDLLGEAETRQRFIAEAIKMARLRHPYVVEILDFDFAGSSPFFTMEYYYQDLGMILGESYRIESPCRMLGLDKVIHYTRRLLLGLSHLHRSGIVHRDIKPSNLLINDENDLKISDFGLSKLRGERLRNPPNLVVGSPYYAAPEQENDPENVDVRADLYSVGIILHRVLTGRFPDGEDLLPSACHPEADASWDSFVLRAIDPSREKRYPGSAAMLIELERLAASWEERKRDICRTASLQGKPSYILGTALQWVRDAPVKVDPGRAPEVFHCDALWRPLEYIRHNLQAFDDDVVFDRQNGLLWERTGAKDPLDWKEAHAYVQQLNECRFAGSRRWRLPTVNELFSILEPFTFGAEDCMAGPFDRGKRWLWSADRRSFIAAWYADCELGFASWSDFTCRYYVRAVCRE